MAIVKVGQRVLAMERWGYIMFILSLFSGFFTFLRPFTAGIRLSAALCLTASNVVFLLNELFPEASDDDKLKQMQRTINRLKREKKMWEVEKQKLMEQVTMEKKEKQKLKEQETTEKNACEEEKLKLNKEQEDEINCKWSKIEEEFEVLKEKHELKMDNLLEEVSTLVEEFEVYGNKVNEKFEVYRNKVNEKLELYQNKVNEKLEVYENKVNEELNHYESEGLKYLNEQYKVNEKLEIYQNKVNEKLEVYENKVNEKLNHYESEGLKFLNEQYKELLNKQQYFISMIYQYYHTGNGSSEESSFTHVPQNFDEVY